MKILIYFGSQTGNSFELATRIDYFFRLNSDVDVELRPINLFDFTKKNESETYFNIICISTTGQGDPPDDSREFWETLMSPDLQFTFTEEFSLFAMGDSSYSRYWYDIGGLELIISLDTTGLAWLLLEDYSSLAVNYSEFGEIIIFM